jgi:hypothetical protein
MVVLQPDRRRLIAGREQGGFGETAIDRLVARPMTRANARQSRTIMTERPQHLVSITEVILFNVAQIETHAVQPIARVFRGYANPTMLVGDVEIRVTTPPGNPVTCGSL